MDEANIVAAAAKRVAGYEQFRAYAYPDPASPLGLALKVSGTDRIGRGGKIPPNLAHLSGDPWTNGYGQTGDDIRYGMPPVTEQAAFAQLVVEVSTRWSAVKKMLKVPVTSGQAIALISLSFNIGIAALRTSTLMRLLNEGKPKQAAEQFDRWVFANGQRMNGLVTRRASEKTLFLS